ncbi:MAG: hypothetical protein RI990_736 [Planctomycetota bacterium]
MRRAPSITVITAAAALALMLAIPWIGGGPPGPRGRAVPSTGVPGASVATARWYVTVHGEAGPLAQVLAVDGDGRVIGTVLGPCPTDEPPLSELRGIVHLADGRLAVVNAKSAASRIIEFDAPDPASGTRAWRRVVARRGTGNESMKHPYQAVVGPDGAYWVTNQDSATVTRHDVQADPRRPGNPEQDDRPDRVVIRSQDQDPDGLGDPRGLAFGPDGAIWICDRGRRRVVIHDPRTGTLRRIVADESNGLGHPIQLAFTADGRSILVTDNLHHCVWRIDARTGAMQALVRPRSGGLDAPSSIAIDGDVLLVGSRHGQALLTFDAADGRFLGTFARLPSGPEFVVPAAGR